MTDPDDSPRPRDLALLMLASGELAPRQRARDQQADRAGGDLKRRCWRSWSRSIPKRKTLRRR